MALGFVDSSPRQASFAKEERINLLVVGKPTRSGFFARFVPSIVQELLDRGSGFEVKQDQATCAAGAANRSNRTR